MKERCYNQNHKGYGRYGGRGIVVCERWHHPEAFIRDNEHLYIPGTTLDRIDNDGPYSPDNCRWVSRKTQGRNRNNNKRIHFNGATMTISEWAEQIGVSQNMLHYRLAKWPLELALTLPKRSKTAPHVVRNH